MEGIQRRRTLTLQHDTERTLASENRRLAVEARRSGDWGEMLASQLASRDSGAAAAPFIEGCLALRGDAVVPTPGRIQLPGKDQLTIDGASLRQVFKYDRKLDPDLRVWSICSETGGVHSHLERDPASAGAWL